jgi:hypothetical protein
MAWATTSPANAITPALTALVITGRSTRRRENVAHTMLRARCALCTVRCKIEDEDFEP